MVTAAHRSFGRRLQDHRERAGITLATIAEATKIKLSLLDDLERGDLSKWPGGIFRRSFVRTYATAVGLPPESLVDEFVQLFPEADTSDVGGAPRAELRLTLRLDPWRHVVAFGIRVITAGAEAGAIVVVAWLAAWMAATNAWTTCAVIALAYYAVSAASIGRSPALWYLQNGLPVRRQP